MTRMGLIHADHFKGCTQIKQVKQLSLSITLPVIHFSLKESLCFLRFLRFLRTKVVSTLIV